MALKVRPRLLLVLLLIMPLRLMFIFIVTVKLMDLITNGRAMKASSAIRLRYLANNRKPTWTL